MPFTVVGGTAVAAAATVVVTVVVPHMQPTQRPSGGGLTLGAPVPGAAGAGQRHQRRPVERHPGDQARDPAAAATPGARASGAPLAASASGHGSAGPTGPATVPGSGAPATATAGTPTATAGRQLTGR